jgi:hypothetical protein
VGECGGGSGKGSGNQRTGKATWRALVETPIQVWAAVFSPSASRCGKPAKGVWPARRELAIRRCRTEPWDPWAQLQAAQEAAGERMQGTTAGGVRGKRKSRKAPCAYRNVAFAGFNRLGGDACATWLGTARAAGTGESGVLSWEAPLVRESGRKADRAATAAALDVRHTGGHPAAAEGRRRSREVHHQVNGVSARRCDVPLA